MEDAFRGPWRVDPGLDRPGSGGARLSLAAGVAQRRLRGGGAVIRRHLLPSFLSYLIVHLILAVPNMILGETALSFIGLGLKAPVVSWGVLHRTSAPSPSAPGC